VSEFRRHLACLQAFTRHGGLLLDALDVAVIERCASVVSIMA